MTLRGSIWFYGPMLPEGQGQLEAKVTALFGQLDSAHEKEHTGLDLAKQQGERWLHLIPGTVRFVSVPSNIPGTWGNVFGYSTIVDADPEPASAGGLCILYAHMSHVPTYPVGARVEVGNTAGFIGQTGQAQGPHMHIGLARRADNPWFQRDPQGGLSLLLDPLAFLDTLKG